MLRGFDFRCLNPRVIIYLVSVKTAEHHGQTRAYCACLAPETRGAKARRNVRATQPENTVRKTP